MLSARVTTSKGFFSAYCELQTSATLTHLALYLPSNLALPHEPILELGILEHDYNSQHLRLEQEDCFTPTFSTLEKGVFCRIGFSLSLYETVYLRRGAQHTLNIHFPKTLHIFQVTQRCGSVAKFILRCKSLGSIHRIKNF